MVFVTAKDRMEEKLCKNLAVLAQSHEYPLTDDTLLMSLNEGISSTGIPLHFDETKREIIIEADILQVDAGNAFRFDYSLPYSEVFRGTGTYFSRSINSLLETNNRIFEMMRRAALLESEDDRYEDFIEKLRLRSYYSIGREFLAQINSRRDAVFLDRRLKQSPNRHSQIMSEVVDRRDLKWYDFAIDSFTPDSLGAYPERIFQLSKMNWSDSNIGYLPTPDCFEAVLWAEYLYEIQRVKGYDLTASIYKGIELFMREGSNALEKSDFIDWGRLTEY